MNTHKMSIEEFLTYWVDFVCANCRQPLMKELEEVTGLTVSSISRYVERCVNEGYLIPAGKYIKKTNNMYSVAGVQLLVRKMDIHERGKKNTQ